jgi:uncharacterized protein (DUF58 family)
MSYFDAFELKEFNNLELLARQVVEGFIIGLHKSPFHGFSVEFAEHRLYNPGESTKNIDWKIYARTDKLFSKKFEEETNLRCQIVIDASSSMYFPELKPDGNRINKIRFSSLAAAAMMNLLKKQRDAFGLSIFDSEVQTHSKCKTSTSHYRLLLTYLDKLIEEPEANKTTAAARALHQIADSIHKRSLVVIFSDMLERMEDTDALLAGLQHLKHNKHEVVLFHVIDQSKEIDFDYDNRPYLFVDLESTQKVKLRSNEVKERYKEQMEEYLGILKMKCLQYKIDFVPTDINEGYNSILQSYLVKRGRMST